MSEDSTDRVEFDAKEGPQDSGAPLAQRLLVLVLFIVGLLFIALCISLIAYKSGLDNNDQAVLQPSHPNEQKRKKATVCDTEDCRYMRQLIVKSLNPKADPCKSFYRYVCPELGNGTHGSHSGMLGVIERDLATAIDHFLVRAAVPKVRQTAPQKAAAFYQSCVLSKDISLEQPMLKSLLGQHDLFFTFPFDFVPLFVFSKLWLRGHIPAVFTMKMVAVPGSQNYVLNFSRSDEFVLWKEKRAELVKQNRYKIYINETVSLVHRSTDEIVDSIMNAENAVLALSDVAYPRGTERVQMPLSQLGSWRNDNDFSDQWIRQLYRASSEGLPGKLTVIAQRRDIEFFHDLFANLRKDNLTRLQVYLTWEVLNYVSRLARMATVAPEEDCKRQVMKFFPFAAFSPVLYRTVNRTRTLHVKAMSSTIMGQIRESFRSAQWWDAHTAKAALQKLHKLSTYYAFPPGMADPEEVEGYYKRFVDIRESFINAYFVTTSIYALHYTYLMTKSSAASINNDAVFRETDRASTVYLPSFNTLYVLAGIMHRPAYVYGAPPEVNYGALGRLIASSVMLGFSGNGRELDGDGRPVDWWTTPSKDAFLEREKCAQNLLGNIGTSPAEPETYVADIMAEESVYRAYKEASKTAGSTLGNVGSLTKDQLFYVSWCLMFCGGDSPSDEASLERRCNGPLMNSKRFAKAFSCPVGAPMNPTQKCHFW